MQGLSVVFNKLNAIIDGNEEKPLSTTLKMITFEESLDSGKSYFSPGKYIQQQDKTYFDWFFD